MAGKQRPRFLRCFVFRIVGRRPRRAEDRDAVRDMRQVFKALYELAHDAKNAPRIGVEKFIGARRLEQLLILCAAVWFLTGITVGHCYPRLNPQSEFRNR